MLNIVKDKTISQKVGKVRKKNSFKRRDLQSFGLPDFRTFRLKIRKVKAVSPSPFYDGKYHPPKMSSLAAAFVITVR